MNEPKRLVLDELRRAFSAVYSAGDTLDNKLQNILNYSSVIATGTSLIITIASSNATGFWYWPFLFLALVLYGVMFVRVRVKLRPTNFSFPIGADMKTLEEKYFDPRFDEERALRQAILDYTHYIAEMIATNETKAAEVNISSWLMFAIVISLFFAVLFGIVLPTV